MGTAEGELYCLHAGWLRFSHAVELMLTPYQAFYASVIVYNVAMCFVKIGIHLQYRRVFAITILQRLTFYGVVIMVAWTITIAFLNALICVPVRQVLELDFAWTLH